MCGPDGLGAVQERLVLRTDRLLCVARRSHKLWPASILLRSCAGWDAAALPGSIFHAQLCSQGLHHLTSAAVRSQIGAAVRGGSFSHECAAASALLQSNTAATHLTGTTIATARRVQLKQRDTFGDDRSR